MQVDALLRQGAAGGGGGAGNVPQAVRDNVEALRARGRVDYIERDQVVAAALFTSATQTGASLPWGLDRIDTYAGLDGAYAYDPDGGANVTEYVVDTGIATGNQEFDKGRATFGADFVNAVPYQGDDNGHGAGERGGARGGGQGPTGQGA